MSPAITLTARLHPAIGRLARITTFASCCQRDSSCSPWLSETVAGVARSGNAVSIIVRAVSIEAVDPLVPTAMADAGSRASWLAGVVAAGHTVWCAQAVTPWGWKSTEATAAPRAQVPSAGSRASWLHSTRLSSAVPDGSR